jgi:GH24 family phage-related lysozyme (muramidase)
MTDKQLRMVLVELEHWEDREASLYLDSRSNPTIGIGCLVPSAVSFASLPLRVEAGALATGQQKRDEFARVAAMPPALGAAAYRGSPRVFLTEEGIDGLAFRRLHTTCTGLAMLCPEFDAFPESAQMCLIDLAWNLGLGKLKEDFPKLVAACNRGDWRTAAIESHVSSSRAARNEWRAQQFFNATKGPTS